MWCSMAPSNPQFRVLSAFPNTGKTPQPLAACRYASAVDASGRLTGPLAKLPGWIQQSLQVCHKGAPAGCCARIAGRRCRARTAQHSYLQQVFHWHLVAAAICGHVILVPRHDAPCRWGAPLVTPLAGWHASHAPWRLQTQQRHPHRQAPAERSALDATFPGSGIHPL